MVAHGTAGALETWKKPSLGQDNKAPAHRNSKLSQSKVQTASSISHKAGNFSVISSKWASRVLLQHDKVILCVPEATIS